jgi:hypothetical protein
MGFKERQATLAEAADPHHPTRRANCFGKRSLTFY